MREILYGRQAVRESLRAGRRQPFRLLLMEGIFSAPVVEEITALTSSQRVTTATVSKHEMARLVGNDDHQGVALETSGYPYAALDEMQALAKQRDEAPLLLLLDLIQDVHNLGSLLRTAEAAGVHGIVIQERRAAGITPAAVNASSGAVEHLLISQATNLVQAMERLKAEGLWIAGLEDVYGAKPYTAMDLRVPLAIVVGSEGEGLRRLVRERCDWLGVLPMRGQINSLNAAVAGSIMLYEVLRQRAQ